jgi:hypothetical protein
MYAYDSSLENATVGGSDNTLPMTLFSCGIPDTDITVEFPVTPVNIPDLIDGGLASSELWTGNYGE